MTLPSEWTQFLNRLQANFTYLVNHSGGGTATDVKINNTSITSNGIADIKTNGTYNATSNKIATMSDLPTVPTNVSAFTNDAGYLTSHQTLKTINNQSIVGSGNLDIGGASRNIGEIVISTIPLTDAGLHLLDGSLISGSGSYADFVSYIADIYDSSANYFCSESDWQTSVTNYGVCGKFVYDSTNNTVRLPRIEGFTESTIDVTTLGNLTEAGLPNITGTFGRTVRDVNPSGAFYEVSSDSWKQFNATNTFLTRTIGMDASRSSSIYGNSTTVQPQSIKVLYYIVIANSTKTEIEVDIDEIATDLNGKADVDGSNMISSVKNFDGAITYKPVRILDGTPSATDSSINLKTTDYLPNDSYKYEVFVSMQLRTSSTSVTASVKNISFNDSGGVSASVRTSSNSTLGYNNFWLPLETNGIIYYKTDAKPNTGITISLSAYRRIGTNT